MVFRDVLDDLLTNAELAALIDRYGCADDVDEAFRTAGRYQELRKHLGAKRFVLPVAGVQGCGKSTLLNAVLFGAPVLPIDADETTCVPAEVRFSSRPDGTAEVRFKDGRRVQVPAREDALVAFLHNEHNPGNELGVDRVVLTSDRSMLEQGMVLVDLPGMGSLTPANLETTKTYLRESVGVVFLLRTVPPLTRSESLFVAANWIRLPLALFLQNRWSDETEAEARSGREYNTDRLREIARQYRIDLDGEVGIQVVNVYAAWRAALQEDAVAMASTGLDDVATALEELGASWPQMLEQSIATAITADIEATTSIIAKLIADLETDAATFEKRIQAESSRFAGYLADIEDKRRKASERIQRFEMENLARLNSWRKSTRSALRNVMRTKMRAGIVDGPQLARALKDEQEDPLEEVFGEFQEECLLLVDKLQESYDDVDAWNAVRRDTTQSVNRKKRTKLEALLPAVGGAGIAVGAGYGGGVLGAKVGASVGFIGGPAGSVIGGIVGGVLGGVLGGFLGRKAKQGITGVRAGNAEPLIDKAIDEFVRGTKADLKQQASDLREHLEQGLSTWQAAQEERYRRERDQRTNSMAVGIEGKAEAVRALRADSDRLLHYREVLG